MRIAFVVNQATYTSIPIEIANMMSKSESVTILSLYDDQAKVEKVCEQIAPNCKCIGFEYKRNKRTGKKRFSQALLDGHYEIVHTHQTFSGALTRWLLRKKTNIKVIHTVHANHNSFSWRQNILIGSTLPFCDCIIFNSESSQKGLKKWQKTITSKVPQRVIYNGIDVARIQNADKSYAQNFCLENGIGDDAFLFAQIGRLEPVKNPILSLQAFNLLLEETSNLNACLVFIGDGSQKSILDEYIDAHPMLRDRVYYTGTIMRDEVYSFLHRVDSMIVPSLHEGFCNALFEGLSAGIPIIASDIEVFRELLDENMGVRKIEINSVEDLVQKMKKSLDETLPQEVRERNKKMAYARFDIERCVTNYLETYREILSEA